MYDALNMQIIQDNIVEQFITRNVYPAEINCYYYYYSKTGKCYGHDDAEMLLWF